MAICGTGAVQCGPMRCLVSPIVFLALAAALIACGGPSAGERARDEYLATIESARTELREQLERIGDEAPPTGTPRSDAEALAEVERVTAGVRERIEAARPPPEAADAHRRLVAAVERFERSLSRARRAGIDADASRVDLLRAALEKETARRSREIDAAIARLNRSLSAGG